MWDDLDEELGALPQPVPIGQDPDPSAVSQEAQEIAINPAVLEARDARDSDVGLANLMQGITQVGTALGSQGRVRADTSAFDAVRDAANRRVAETSKDVESHRKLVSDAMKARAAEARGAQAEDWRKKNYEQRERGIEATRLNQEKPNQYQAQSATFAQALEEAEADFASLESKGYDPSNIKIAAKQSFLPNFLQSPESQQQQQAELNFLNATLRNESGASINKDEFRKGEKQYFIRGGDSPEVKEQKRRNRAQRTASMRAAAGSFYGKIPQIRAQSSAFPRQVRNGNKIATVKSQKELESANAKGFR